MTYRNSEKILLILDVDETLIHATRVALARPADFMVFGYHIYKRPFLQEFLFALKNHFELAIWSSAGDDYVQEIVKQIIPPEIPLAFVWGRSRCSYKRNLMDDYDYYNADPDSHFHFVKPLKKLKRHGYALERILIVDDTPHKSRDNYGNAIYPKPFTGNVKDDELQQLVLYLELLKDKKNVRIIEKRNWRNRVGH